MAEQRRYYRRIIVLEVLSNEPIETQDLAELHYEINDGESSGWFIADTTIEVDRDVMRGLLLAQQSDPNFLLGEEDVQLLLGEKAE